MYMKELQFPVTIQSINNPNDNPINLAKWLVNFCVVYFYSREIYEKKGLGIAVLFIYAHYSLLHLCTQSTSHNVY